MGGTGVEEALQNLGNQVKPIPGIDIGPLRGQGLGLGGGTGTPPPLEPPPLEPPPLEPPPLEPPPDGPPPGEEPQSEEDGGTNVGPRPQKPKPKKPPPGRKPNPEDGEGDKPEDGEEDKPGPSEEKVDPEEVEQQLGMSLPFCSLLIPAILRLHLRHSRLAEYMAFLPYYGGACMPQTRPGAWRSGHTTLVLPSATYGRIYGVLALGPMCFIVHTALNTWRSRRTMPFLYITGVSLTISDSPPRLEKRFIKPDFSPIRVPAVIRS